MRLLLLVTLLPALAWTTPDAALEDVSTTAAKNESDLQMPDSSTNTTDAGEESKVPDVENGTEAATDSMPTTTTTTTTMMPTVLPTLAPDMGETNGTTLTPAVIPNTVVHHHGNSSATVLTSLSAVSLCLLSLVVVS